MLRLIVPVLLSGRMAYVVWRECRSRRPDPKAMDDKPASPGRGRGHRVG